MSLKQLNLYKWRPTAFQLTSHVKQDAVHAPKLCCWVSVHGAIIRTQEILVGGIKMTPYISYHTTLVTKCSITYYAMFIICLAMQQWHHTSTSTGSLWSIDSYTHSLYTKLCLLTFQVTSFYFREFFEYIYKSNCALLQDSWLEYKR